MIETKLRKILAHAEELQEALAEARKHNAIILEEHRTALEQLAEANKKLFILRDSAALLLTGLRCCEQSSMNFRNCRPDKKRPLVRPTRRPSI
jgi:hypothetical protein